MKHKTMACPRFIRAGLFAVIVLFKVSVSKAQVNIFGPNFTEVSAATPSALMGTINCDMMQRPNVSNQTLKAIVWHESSISGYNAYLFVDYNGTALTTSPIQISGGESPDVAIGDDMSAQGNGYIIAVVYTIHSLAKVYVQYFYVDLNLNTVSSILGSTTQLNSSSGAKYPHIDMFVDPQNTIGGFPAMHQYAATWESSGSILEYTTGDVSGTPSSPTTLISGSQVTGEDIAATVNSNNDQIANIVYSGTTGTNVLEYNITTSTPSNISLSTTTFNNRIESLGFYNGSNAKWLVVGETGSPSVIYAQTDLSTSVDCSSTLSTTASHDLPTVAAGAGNNTTNIGNNQYTIGWNTIGTSPTLYSQNIDIATGLQISSNDYYVINKNAISSSWRDLALSSSSNTGYGLLSTWYDGTDIVYKETSTSGTFGFKPAAINNLHTDNQTIYPNPAIDKLTVNMQPGTHYNIIDVTGRNVQQGELSLDKNIHIPTLPVYTC